jgi:hypothetical protein
MHPPTHFTQPNRPTDRPGHYKWYVLLRQHYLTMGDSCSPWLGHAVTPHQQDGVTAPSPAGHLDGDGRPYGADGDAMSPAASLPAPLGDAGAGGSGGGLYEPPKDQVVIEMTERQRGRAPREPLGGGAASPEPPSGLTSRQSSTRVLLGAAAVDSVMDSYLETGGRWAGGGSLGGCGRSPAERRRLTRPQTESRPPTRDESGFDCSDSGLAPLGFTPHPSFRRQPSLRVPSFLRRIGSATGGGGPGSMSRRRGAGAGADGSGGGVTSASPYASLRQARPGAFGTVAFQSVDEEEAEEEARWRASKAAAARTAAATAATGADREWYEFRTRDPLLDRHIARLDLADELAWDKAEPGGWRLDGWTDGL